jgi:hypothetical protein
MLNLKDFAVGIGAECTNSLLGFGAECAKCAKNRQILGKNKPAFAGLFRLCC